MNGKVAYVPEDSCREHSEIELLSTRTMSVNNHGSINGLLF